MWFEEISELCEMFRTSFPYSIMFFVPLLIIISPVSPAAGAHEFSVFRMQQFELHGSAYGSKNAIVNVEARPIDAKVLTRRCVITKLKEFTIEKYKDIANQNSGGILVLLPRDLDKLGEEERQHFREVEHDIIQEESQLPVYFATESKELLEIYEDVKDSVNSDQASSGAEALMGAASANGFQLVTNAQQAKALNDFQIINIQGKLTGAGIEEQLPTIVIVAHYDAFGVAPALAKGGDSNASGVAALLELARLFSKLYTNSRTHAKYNVLFLLSGAGKFNYQGTKRWIEDQLESTESTLLSDATYILCLDAVGNGDNLNLHVSKPPKENTPGHLFMNNIKQASEQFYPDAKFEMVHKKINLAEDLLAWEHERFSIRRLLAFTLSHLHSHKALERNSILDTRNTVDSAVIARNVKIIAEAVARHLFNLTGDNSFEIFTDGLTVEEESIQAWLDLLTSYPRAAQLLEKDGPVVSSLEQAMSKYLKDVSLHSFKADKRDPDFLFFDLAETTMSAYNVKPAVFDLFLAVAIAAYLGVIFLFVQNFNKIYTLVKRLIGPSSKTKIH